MKEKNADSRYYVSGICCASEEVLLRKKLDALVGEGSYRYHVLTGELVIDKGVEEARLRSVITRAGFGIRNSRDNQDGDSLWARHGDAIVVAGAAVLALSGIIAQEMTGTSLLSRGMLLVSIVVGGWNVFPKAWRALRSGALDMNVLMTAAVGGALAIDEWAEGAAVIVLFGLSLALESYSIARTRRAVESLMESAPSETTVVRSGRRIVVPSAEVQPGEIVLLLPGERIALDGEVVEGSSEVNQAAITGESLPVLKGPGTEVYAGSLNQRGSLHVRVTRRFEGTLLSRMIHLVERSEEKRAPVQMFLERFAAVYTPAVFVLSVLTALVPPLIFSEPFADWFYRSLVLLVIACPCALVISTPVTIVSAITSAARRGVLIKGGLQLEKLSRTRVIAFDKTGTLTEGRPAVTDIIPFDGTKPEFLLTVAAALEDRSEHPVAAAVLVAADRAEVPFRQLSVEGFESFPGLGVRGVVNGERCFAGNLEFTRRHGAVSEVFEDRLAKLSAQGKTGLVVGGAAGPLGIIGVRDTPRSGGKEALARLRLSGIDQMALFSGDRVETVHALGEELNVNQVQGEMLPEAKVHAISNLQNEYGPVAMVGDGVNDAPAMAAATVGIAMGVSGADTTLETADVVLLSDDLNKLPMIFQLSRKAMNVVRQNIAIALAVKGVFLVLSMTGYATLWMAILADDGAALAVILNGLRLLIPEEGGDQLPVR
ncbi:MAG: heavy metal translocating P-type ATPase [Ignavibacteria bacterium]|nr:heavy metal translocating P-type ATPase [Ignavibacteria bacterium]